jgi:hypothetical protein
LLYPEEHNETENGGVMLDFINPHCYIVRKEEHS